jgi:adenylosuccinate synthase
MPLDILVGAQWGDEGKGRITDLLAADAHIVARYSGGDNAGHTVTIGQRTYKLHLIPSGIIHPHTHCVMGNGMVINPATMIRELDHLEQSGIDIDPARLMLSHAAHIITPAHTAMDGAEETRRAASSLGTTRRGIGPAYHDKAARRGIRAEEMVDVENFGRRVAEQVLAAGETLSKVYGVDPPDAQQAQEDYASYADRLRRYVGDVGEVLDRALRDGRTVLGEGAQGTLLDLDHGSYPYVTSSNPTASGAPLGLGIGPGYVRRIIGVAKAFQTRVGEGPFPTELAGQAAERLRGTGQHAWDEFGTTTGRPRRVGWLDAVLLRYAARVNGLTELVLTKLDVLSAVDPLNICVAYTLSGQRCERLVGGLAELGSVEPLFETQETWAASLWSARTWVDLPEAAREYVEHIEELTGLPISLISVGPEREQVIQGRRLAS